MRRLIAASIAVSCPHPPFMTAICYWLDQPGVTDGDQPGVTDGHISHGQPGFFFLLKHPPIFGPFPSEFFPPLQNCFSPLQNFVSPPLSVFPSIPRFPLQSIFPRSRRHFFSILNLSFAEIVSIAAYWLIRMRKCCRIFLYVNGGLRKSFISFDWPASAAWN